MTTEFFHKAEDNLNVARLCFDNGYYDACANRAYYAALQAAVAALEDQGIRRGIKSSINGFMPNSAKN